MCEINFNDLNCLVARYNGRLHCIYSPIAKVNNLISAIKLAFH